MKPEIKTFHKKVTLIQAQDSQAIMNKLNNVFNRLAYDAKIPQ